MGGEPAESDRVRELLAELDDAASRPGRDLALLVTRRAARQLTALSLGRLLAVVFRSVPEAVALATRRR